MQLHPPAVPGWDLEGPQNSGYWSAMIHTEHAQAPPLSSAKYMGRPSSEQWSIMKEKIIELCSHQSLEEVRQIIRHRYGFWVTDGMIKSRLSAWGVRKKLNGMWSYDNETVPSPPPLAFESRDASLNFHLRATTEAELAATVEANVRHTEEDINARSRPVTSPPDYDRDSTRDENILAVDALIRAQGSRGNDRFREPPSMQEQRRQRNREALRAYREDRDRFIKQLEDEQKQLELDLERLKATAATGVTYKPAGLMDSLADIPMRRHKVLPIGLQRSPPSHKVATLEQFDAVPDTGSDENAMDWQTCKSLGLNLIRGKHSRKEFQLANGKPFKSMGRVIVPATWNTTSISRHPETFDIVFNVFSKLASPVILGKEFLDDTETLTKHQYRLAWRADDGNQQLRIMHFNRPGSRIQCAVNGHAVSAHADTGAEMNLVHPSFARKLGKNRHSLTKEDVYIQLADGSCERIHSSFEGTVDIDGLAGNDRTSTKFYVLPGLTSEALLGEDTLYKMDVFTNHLDAFVDIFTNDEQASLNIIKWLTERESRFINSVSRRSTNSAGKAASPSDLPDSSLSDKAFRSALVDADARELHRREQAETRIAGLADRQRASARDAERIRVAAYDSQRATLLDMRQQRVNSHQP